MQPRKFLMIRQLCSAAVAGALACGGASATQDNGDAGPGPLTCEGPTHCVAIRRDCCGGCVSEPVAAAKGETVRAYDESCITRGCPPCKVEARWVPTCSANQCALQDLYVSPLSACQVDADCRMRWTAECCEPCWPAPTDLVSVSRSADFSAFCAPRYSCDPCGVMPYPPTAVAVCRQGHCMVE
jgi:hypothetical protein